jgi:putative Mg2+ transporter-C (MgtC) family protein
MEYSLGFIDIVARLLLALFAGAALGWEREAKDKPAGLRTHMLVALGAAVCIVAGLQYSAAVDPQHDYSTISRVIQGIIGGVGFLGAGSIIQSRGAVHGITTAASIWVVAAIGIASGLGQYMIAILGAGLSLFVLHGIIVLERYMFPATNRAKGLGPPGESETNVYEMDLPSDRKEFR